MVAAIVALMLQCIGERIVQCLVAMCLEAVAISPSAYIVGGDVAVPSMITAMIDDSLTIMAALLVAVVSASITFWFLRQGDDSFLHGSSFPVVDFSSS